MKYQFKNHDYEIVIPEQYEVLFQGNEGKLETLKSLLFSLPPFQNVEQGAPLLPLLGSLHSSKTIVVSAFELALMDMIELGLGNVSEMTMLFYIARKLKELELFHTIGAMPGQQPEAKKPGGLIL